MTNGDHSQLSLFDLLDDQPARAGATAHGVAGILPQVIANDAAGGGVMVEAERLKSACGAHGRMICGDIAASYSADLLATKKEGDNIRTPFLFQGRRYVCVGMVPGRSAFALRLMTRREFDEAYGGAKAAEPSSSYHGQVVRHGGEELMLAGPEIIFKATPDAPTPFDGDGGRRQPADTAQPDGADGGADADGLAGVTVYRSGMSSRSDFTGYANASVPIGVQIGDLSEPMAGLLAEYNAKGGLLFIDSGAFGAFRKGRAINFQRVLAAYRALIAQLPRKSGVALVMPDVIGDQAATLALLRQYADEIVAFIAEGCDVIVPIQKGGLSLAEAYAAIIGILGTDQFRVALPSNKVAVTTEEAIEFAAQVMPRGIHLLGIAKQKRFAALVAGLRRAAPAARLSSDANFLRAMVGRNRPLSRAIEERLLDESKDIASDGDYARGLPDETELTFDVYNTPGYLDERMARELAPFVSSDQLVQAQIIKAALSGERGVEFGSRIGDLIELHCPDRMGEQAIRLFLLALVRKRIRRDIRAEEITRSAAPAPPRAGARKPETEAPAMAKAG